MLPSEIGDRIGTSTLFAAWNAAIYVNQIEDERLDTVVTTGEYLDATQAVLKNHGGLWFNDETFLAAVARSSGFVSVFREPMTPISVMFLEPVERQFSWVLNTGEGHGANFKWRQSSNLGD